MTNPLFRLDGRVALITGTSSGLGHRFAEVLDAAGANLVLAARRQDANLELAGRLRDALPVACDIRDTADRERLLAADGAVRPRLDHPMWTAAADGWPGDAAAQGRQPAGPVPAGVDHESGTSTAGASAHGASAAA
jgi:NAD(P)-dependent dehydrogenase (short-subunit alcohol dehydrogenase family)